jgi:hypothetical protein
MTRRSMLSPAAAVGLFTLFGLVVPARTALGSESLDTDRLAKKAEDPKADTLPKELREPQPVDKEHPLPQDAAKSAERRAARLAWLREHYLTPFDTHGNTKAAWAQKVHAAIDAYCIAKARESQKNSGVYYQEFLKCLTEAVEAGADDPLVQYWDYRFLLPRRMMMGELKPLGGDENLRRIRAIRDGLHQSRYGPVCRMHAGWNLYLNTNGLGLPRETFKTVPKDEINRAFANFWVTFGQAVRDTNSFTQKEVVDMACLAAQFYGRGFQVDGWNKSMRTTLADHNASEWVRLMTEGECNVKGAWDARGSGTADTVSPEGWKLFNERLERAKECFEQAWKLDHSRPEPAVSMITIATGQSLDRDTMERWFRRAMTADPDCHPACSAKMNYLEPKWHGSEEDAADFARQCYRTKNWYAGLPFVLTDHYSEMAMLLRATGQQVPDKIWDEVEAVHRGNLAVYPDDQWAKTLWLRESVIAGRWKSARAAADKIGDKFWPDLIGGPDQYRAVVDEIDRRLNVGDPIER